MTDAPLTCDVSLHIPDLDCVFLISANENYNVFFLALALFYTSRLSVLLEMSWSCFGQHCLNVDVFSRIRYRLVTLRASCGAVYCNRPCLFVCVCMWVGLLLR